MVLGLEVDEHVGVAQALLDRGLELGAHLVSAFQRRAFAELHVEIDMAPAAGAAPEEARLDRTEGRGGWLCER